MSSVFIAIRVTLVTLVLTAVAYPAVVTGAAQLLFPARANGSLVQDDRGRVTGSELIGQSFNSPGYFQPRPSAAGAGYDGLASSGSNWGPTSEKLKARIATDLVRLKAENPEAPGPVPAELVTASASGLDPHVSPESVLWQLPRVARARGVSPERIRTLVDAQVEGRDFGIFGEPRVNVLLLNLALDRQFGRLVNAPQPPIGG
jgi:K+-transporting ATPase ATPase C chain